jgi:putative two-component system response regulator
VVDDERANVAALLRILDRAGYGSVEGTSDPRAVSRLMRELEPDLLLLDLRMPHLDGFEVLEEIRGTIPDDQYLPVLVITGDLSPEVRERALTAGAKDFVTKPFDVTEILLRIQNLLETRVLHLQLREHNHTLERRVRERTRELAEAQVEILYRLARAAEYRDDVTGRHADRVGVLAALLAREVGLGEEPVRLIRWAATLHDVGKIGIPDAILMKPGPLSRGEYELIKSHTEIGERILSGSRFPLLRMAAEIARYHHERWDGRGYLRISGEEIPVTGRIVAVADVFDSLTHFRPYKHAEPEDVAVALILSERGGHFDPAIVDAFESLHRTGAVSRLDMMVEEGRESGAEGVPASLLTEA